MFQTIREKLTGWVAIAVIAVIGIPLVISMGNMDAGSTGSNLAARVNGEEISKVEFDRVFRSQLLAQQQSLRGELPAGAEDQLKRNVLDSLVLTRAITQYAESAGYRVGDDRVAEHIRQLPVFQVGGKFSRPAYEGALATQGIAPATFETEQRQLLAVSQLQDGLAASAFYTPAEFRRLLTLEGERRRVAYVLIDTARLAGASSVSEDDIQAFYSTNSAQFQRPESVTLEYIEIRLADMAPGYEPAESELREAYDADPTRFRSAEERRARHILVAVNAQRDDAAAAKLAADISAQLAQGADFAALAAKHSDDPGSASRGGDLGWAGAGAYAAPFEEALFALDAGETTGPVRTEFGYHLIRLEEIRPGSERPFEAVRDQLAAEVRSQKAQDEYYALAERLDDLALENPASLEPAATATGLPLKRLAGYTRAGGGVFGNNQNLLGAVFSETVLEGGENTPLIELDEDRAIVARVAEYLPAAPRPLAEVRDEVAAQLRLLRANTEARSRAAAIREKTGAGMNLAAAAAAVGERLVEPGPVSRVDGAVPPELLRAMFSAPKPTKGPVVEVLDLTDGGYAAAYEVFEVIPGNADSIPADIRDQRKAALARQSAVVETEALARSLRESASVVVADDLFEKPDEES
jgi:peptidyl-prolyl cis-trans isomerase D